MEYFAEIMILSSIFPRVSDEKLEKTLSSVGGNIDRAVENLRSRGIEEKPGAYDDYLAVHHKKASGGTRSVAPANPTVRVSTTAAHVGDDDDGHEAERRELFSSPRSASASSPAAAGAAAAASSASSPSSARPPPSPTTYMTLEERVTYLRKLYPTAYETAVRRTLEETKGDISASRILLEKRGYEPDLSVLLGPQFSILQTAFHMVDKEFIVAAFEAFEGNIPDIVQYLNEKAKENNKAFRPIDPASIASKVSKAAAATLSTSAAAAASATKERARDDHDADQGDDNDNDDGARRSKAGSSNLKQNQPSLSKSGSSILAASEAASGEDLDEERDDSNGSPDNTKKSGGSKSVLSSFKSLFSSSKKKDSSKNASASSISASPSNASISSSSSSSASTSVVASHVEYAAEVATTTADVAAAHIHHASSRVAEAAGVAAQVVMQSVGDTATKYQEQWEKKRQQEEQEKQRIQLLQSASKDGWDVSAEIQAKPKSKGLFSFISPAATPAEATSSSASSSSSSSYPSSSSSAAPAVDLSAVPAFDPWSSAPSATSYRLVERIANMDIKIKDGEDRSALKPAVSASASSSASDFVLRPSSSRITEDLAFVSLKTNNPASHDHQTTDADHDIMFSGNHPGTASAAKTSALKSAAPADTTNINATTHAAERVESKWAVEEEFGNPYSSSVSSMATSSKPSGEQRVPDYQVDDTIQSWPEEPAPTSESHSSGDPGTGAHSTSSATIASEVPGATMASSSSASKLKFDLPDDIMSSPW